MIDYRLTKFENYNYSEISQNKLILGNEIDARARTNVGKHYDKIKSKESTYYEKFEKIYYKDKQFSTTDRTKLKKIINQIKRC